jgi:hypothetical protein
MQMNDYALSNIFQRLQNADCRQCYVEFSDHGPYQAVFFFFQKQRQGWLTDKSKKT